MLDAAYSVKRLNYHSEMLAEDNVVGLFHKYRVPRRFDLYVCIIDGPDFVVSRRLLQPLSMDAESAASAQADDMVRLQMSGLRDQVSYFRPRVIAVNHVHGYFFPDHAVPLNLTLIPKTAAADRRKSENSESFLDLPWKSYQASLKAMMKLLGSFGYDLIYIGLHSALFVDSRAFLETPGEIDDDESNSNTSESGENNDSNNGTSPLTEVERETLQRGRRYLQQQKNQLRSLCHRTHMSSQRSWVHGPVGSHLDWCDKDVVDGFSEAELRQKYWYPNGWDRFSAEDIWDRSVAM